MDAQMAIPQWHDLTQEEQQAIAELYTGFTSLLTARMAERLKALGLAEQKVGGTGLTEQGRKLFESR
jgi:Mn-dependent DtxR family transcriptional regulator